MSYSNAVSNNGKVEKHSVVVTSDVYLDLVLLKLFSVNHGFGFVGFCFKVHLDFTLCYFFNSKSCVAYFQVYQRCRSLGIILEHHPLLFMKDPRYTSRQEIQLNFSEEMHTVCFGRYYPYCGVIDLTNGFMTPWRIKLLSLETDYMLSASEILHDVGKKYFSSPLMFTNAKVAMSVRTPLCNESELPFILKIHTWSERFSPNLRLWV